MGLKPELMVTHKVLNWLLLFVGLVIVGLSTNWNAVALLGAFVASIHVCFRFQEPTKETKQEKTK